MDNSVSKDALRMREYRKSQQYKEKANERREKKHRKKFIGSGNYVEHISTKHIQNRFKLFNYCCAYCGSYEGIDIQIEHVVPRSKGGAHCMANIIPACGQCNRSKYNNEMVTWYKQQTFYTKERLKKIKDILSSTAYPVQQINLFPEWMINS